MYEMIDLDFYDSSSKYGIIKATVHKSGKLGFSSGASKFMRLETRKFVRIATNKSNLNDKCLYVLPIEDQTDKSFKVVKAGDYYYVFIRNILQERNLDYKTKNFVYDIEEFTQGDLKGYKLIQREIKEKKGQEITM